MQEQREEWSLGLLQAPRPRDGKQSTCLLVAASPMPKTVHVYR